MNRIGQFFQLLGLLLAAMLGYAQLSWYYLFAGSLSLSIGWGLIRLPQLYSLKNRDGVKGLLHIAILQILMNSLISGPIFFIARFFG
jgi:hypothetical protein